MAGILGWITDLTSGQARSILRRTPEIDAMLSSAGYDPSTVNCAHTPLVGASDHARITVLVMASEGQPGARPAFVDPLQDLQSTVWEMWLMEPGGSSSPVSSYPSVPATTLGLPSIVPVSRFDIEFENQGGGEPPELTGDESQEQRPTILGAGSAIEETKASGLVALAGEMTRKQASGMLALAGGGSDGAGDGPDIGTNSGGNQTGSGGTASPTVEALNSTPARAMHWKNLIPTSIRELRRNAAGLPQVNANGRPRSGDSALFVIEFVDYRYALQSIFGAYSYSQIAGRGTPSGFFKDSRGNGVNGGPIRSTCFNMLAETPTALEAQTTKLTYIYPPSVSKVPFGTFDGDPDNSGSISETAIPIANLAASPTLVQATYGFQDIVEQLSLTVGALTKNRLRLSLENWNRSVSASEESLIDDGDLLNLDLRGMSVGQALDAFAQRIGATWVWDRSDACLLLQLVSSDNSKFDVPNFDSWLAGMETHRVSGYINTLTLDIPKTVIVSHESIYCSSIGPYEYANDGDAMSLDEIETYAHYVDCRSATTDGGTVSTKFVTGLNTRAPMIWHTSDNVPAHLSIEIKDHVPAFIGSYLPPGQPIISLPGANVDVYSRKFGNYGMRMGVGNAGGEQSTAEGFMEYTPWNFNFNSLPMAFKSNPVNGSSGPTIRPPSDPTSTTQSVDRLRVTLLGRRQIYEQRMNRLRAVVDGDMVCNRMPPQYWDSRTRQHTPSVGLQYDSVEFGFDGPMTVRYRIFGKNTNPLLYPHGAAVKRVSGGPNVHAFTTTGTQNITVRRRESNNIKRAFLCRFEPSAAISDSLKSTKNPGNLPFIYLYKFVEVVPEINAATMWFSHQDALGWGRAEGYALNICEMNYSSDKGVPFTPEIAWDGTQLQFRDKDSSGTVSLEQIYPTAPAGYAICYEIYNRAGFTSYYLFAPPGLEVSCARSSFTQAPAPWPYMGVSGVATPSGGQVVDDIMGA